MGWPPWRCRCRRWLDVMPTGAMSLKARLAKVAWSARGNTVVVGVATALGQRDDVIHVGCPVNAHAGILELAGPAVALENPCASCLVGRSAGSPLVDSLPDVLRRMFGAIPGRSPNQLRAANFVAGPRRTGTHLFSARHGDVCRWPCAGPATCGSRCCNTVRRRSFRRVVSGRTRWLSSSWCRRHPFYGVGDCCLG